MTCNLFETCGQYLYRSPDSHHMTNLLLQQMMRLKSHMHVNTRYEIMIQNAFYLVVPDDKTVGKKFHSLRSHCSVFHAVFKSRIACCTSLCRIFDFRSFESFYNIICSEQTAEDELDR